MCLEQNSQLTVTLPSDPYSDSASIEQNRRTYDRMARQNNPLCRPATTEELADPLGTVDKIGWLGGDIRGQNVLCLAAGGGRQSALYCRAGGIVTVVDISNEMLELDRLAAQQHSMNVRAIQANMQSMPMLHDAEFDLVIHPVSTCYVPQIAPVFAEVARVLKGGGLYISQHKQPVSLQAGLAPHAASGSYHIQETYYRDNPIPASNEHSSAAERLREEGAVEFLHRWEEILGGMCRAGFVIEDLVEPLHSKADAAPGSFGHRASFIAPYVRIKARRKTEGTAKRKTSVLITDGF